MTSPWLFVMVDHWLTSGMERSLAKWEESQGIRAELDEAWRKKKNFILYNKVNRDKVITIKLLIIK